MDARSEEIGRLLREQERAIIAERAQTMRLAGRVLTREQAQQAGAREQEAKPITRARERITGRTKAWLVAEGATFVLGLVFLIIGAEMNSPDLRLQPPAATTSTGSRWPISITSRSTSPRRPA